MKIMVLILSWALMSLEWYVIRRTRIKAHLPILVATLVGLPIGLLYGLHLVTYPILSLFLSWAFCLLEDEWHKFLKGKRMTEEKRSRLRDL